MSHILRADDREITCAVDISLNDSQTPAKGWGRSSQQVLILASCRRTQWTHKKRTRCQKSRLSRKIQRTVEGQRRRSLPRNPQRSKMTWWTSTKKKRWRSDSDGTVACMAPEERASMVCVQMTNFSSLFNAGLPPGQWSRRSSLVGKEFLSKDDEVTPCHFNI